MKLTLKQSIAIFIVAFFCSPIALALNINSVDKYAWGENIGWINFGTVEGDVDLLGGSMDGYAWGENVGWISFSCTNTASCGTVNYGVTYSAFTNEFSGYAWGENVGWINFNCANNGTCGSVNFKVKYGSTTPTPADPVIIIVPPAPTPITTPTPTATPPPTATPSAAPTSTLFPTPFYTPVYTPTPTSTYVFPTPTGPAFTPYPSIQPSSSPPPSQPANPPVAAGGGAPTTVGFGTPTPSPQGVSGIVQTIAAAADSGTTAVVNAVSTFVEDACQGVSGSVACGSTAVTTVAVTQAVAGGQVLLLFRSFPQIFGLARRKRVFGVVYDARTKKPIAHARVEMIDQFGRVLETKFTDFDGRYAFLANVASTPSVSVSIRVSKSGFTFPSFTEPTAVDTTLYENIYRGGQITPPVEGVLNFNIPVDPIDTEVSSVSTLSWWGRAVTEKILITGFILGVIVNPLNYYLLPTTLKFWLLVFFFVTNAIRILVARRPYGVVLDSATGKPMAFALITITDESGKRAGFTVSDELGRYVLNVPPGHTYTIETRTPAAATAVRSSHYTFTSSSGMFGSSWITSTLSL